MDGKSALRFLVTIEKQTTWVFDDNFRDNFTYFSIKTYIKGIEYNHLISTHSIFNFSGTGKEGI